MCNVSRVRWTITPRISPRPWIACSGCGRPRPFHSSGKVRLNANGRKLDAWLIYRCLDCGRSWNRPLVKRRNVRDIDPIVLAALHFSDPAWVRAQEFDVDGLRRHTQRVDEFADVTIDRKVCHGMALRGELVIEIKIALPVSLRLDRLVAAELGLSRSKLQSLHEQGTLVIDPDREGVLRRRVKDGTRIVLKRDDVLM
ncbi:MAG: DUF1062 domain-containing protein [Parvibaculaceae bacterium]